MSERYRKGSRVARQQSVCLSIWRSQVCKFDEAIHDPRPLFSCLSVSPVATPACGRGSRVERHLSEFVVICWLFLDFPFLSSHQTCSSHQRSTHSLMTCDHVNVCQCPFVLMDRVEDQQSVTVYIQKQADEAILTGVNHKSLLCLPLALSLFVYVS